MFTCKSNVNHKTSKDHRRRTRQRPPWMAKVTREERAALEAPLNVSDFEKSDCNCNECNNQKYGGGAAEPKIEEPVMTEHGSQTENENPDASRDASQRSRDHSPTGKRPNSWSYDPILAAYSRLLKGAGGDSVLDSATLDRWRVSASPSSTDTALINLDFTATPRMASPFSGDSRTVVSEAMPGDGSPGMVGQADASLLSDASFDHDGYLRSQGGAGRRWSDQPYVPQPSPAALLLIPGHLPIRLDCFDSGLVLTLLSYSPGLRRCGDRGTYTAEQLRAALRAARRGFSALRMTMSVCYDDRSIATASLPHADERFLARQLRFQFAPHPHSPTVALSSAEPVAIGGVSVRLGAWIWVRLETNTGLTMTEPALLLAAHNRESFQELTLRGLDRLTFTCITSGPGWTRRVVPMQEAEVWRSLANQDRLLSSRTNRVSSRTRNRGGKGKGGGTA